MSMERRPDESIATFSDKFLRILTDAEIPLEDAQLIHQFLLLLPADDRRFIHRERYSTSNGYIPFTSVLQAMDLAKACEALDRIDTSSFKTSQQNSQLKKSPKGNLQKPGDKPTLCTYCKKKGHLEKECYKKKCDLEAKSSTTANSGSKSPQNQQSVTCHKCRKQGHYANKCPELQKEAINQRSEERRVGKD